MFRTPKPKEFTYKPRYYDEEKERLEQRKAELGYDSKLTHHDGLRSQMSRKWRRGTPDPGTKSARSLFYYIFYAGVILGGIYIIFFTDFVNKLVALFGVGN